MRTQIFISLFLFANSAFSQNVNESYVFSFSTENDKVITLNLDTIKNELIYRYGDNHSPEIEVRDNLDDSLVIFTYSYYLRGGGIVNSGLDLNYLNFNNGNSKYTIYSEYSAEGNSTSIGIRILNLSSGKEYEISGLTETLSGSLIAFRDIIPIEEDL